MITFKRIQKVTKDVQLVTIGKKREKAIANSEKR